MQIIKTKSLSRWGRFIGFFTGKKTGKEIWRSPVYKNTFVTSNGYGRNIIARQIVGDTTYALPIDSAKIGTGSTAPTESDTDLETPTYTKSGRDSSSVSNNIVTIDWFLTDANLANGTYREFGMFSNGRLMTRALFASAYIKSSGEDTRVRYTLEF